MTMKLYSSHKVNHSASNCSSHCTMRYDPGVYARIILAKIDDQMHHMTGEVQITEFFSLALKEIMI